jgi:Asp-tRNA(Asn)/Glu-tRNA(Gln) amidotransferase A subunit family amidase
MPTTAIPITKVNPEEQTGYRDEINGEDVFTSRVKKCMKNAAGLPVGIQVSTLPYEDEKCLAVSRMIEASLNLKAEILL